MLQFVIPLIRNLEFAIVSLCRSYFWNSNSFDFGWSNWYFSAGMSLSRFATRSEPSDLSETFFPACVVRALLCGSQKNRIRKLSKAIGDALRDNALTPAAASRLAGKLAFLTQATFGAVGKAALQPLYSRSHDTSPNTTDELSDSLRAALNAIHAMLHDIQPALRGRLRQDRREGVQSGLHPRRDA